MAIVDSAPEGGKFRAKAASGLDGTAGAWGDGNLLNVTFDGSGDLTTASATNAIGVILTTEGKRDNTHADYKKVVGGDFYTVFRRAIFVETDAWTSPTVSAGDTLYAAASGDMTTTSADEAVTLGWVANGDGTAGAVAIIDVAGAAPPGALSGGDLTFTAVAGAVAGNVTVTGIATTDTLVSVIFIDATDASETVSDLSGEFSIDSADTIDNTGGTDTSGGNLLVFYTS